jgi:hypothetical protein
VIDYWKLVKDFKIGDAVQRYAPGQHGYSLSPFIGRVTCVHKGLGIVDVQWPYGNERMFPDDVIRVDPKIMGWLPPTLDQTYDSWDVRHDRQASAAKRMWRTTEVPAGFHRDLAFAWAKGANEVGAYDILWRRHSANADDAAIRDEISKFYRVAANLQDLRLQVHAAKTSAYWASSNRQYRATSGDMGSRKPACPKCGTAMRKTTYKMDKGARVRLFACPSDLFLIRQADLLGPGGEPVEW